MRRSIWVWGLLWFILLITLCGCGGDGGTDPAQRERAFTFDSKIINDKYQIRVSLPAGYNAESTSRYSTIYLLDANWSFEGVKNIVTVHQNEIEPLIIVGICPIQALDPGYTGTSPSRCRDLTPTVFETEAYPNSGGADDFAEFLKTELIPYIDSHYRTIPDAPNRCLVGGSLSGLFVCYSLMSYTDTYRKFLAASPSLWWDNFVMLSYEDTYAKTHSELNATLFTSASTGEDAIMVTGLNGMASILTARNYSGFTLRTQILAGYTHEQAAYPSFEAGIPWLFKK